MNVICVCVCVCERVSEWNWRLLLSVLSAWCAHYVVRSRMVPKNMTILFSILCGKKQMFPFCVCVCVRVFRSEWIWEINQRQTRHRMVAQRSAGEEWRVNDFLCGMHILSGNDLYLQMGSVCELFSFHARNPKVIVVVLCHTLSSVGCAARWTANKIHLIILNAVATSSINNGTHTIVKWDFGGGWWLLNADTLGGKFPNQIMKQICRVRLFHGLSGLRNWFNNAAAKICYEPLCIWMCSNWHRSQPFAQKKTHFESKRPQMKKKACDGEDDDDDGGRAVGCTSRATKTKMGVIRREWICFFFFSTE